MRVTFCGVRGSTPAPGAAFLRYGGNTSCIAVAQDGALPSLVLDGGTGLRVLNRLMGDAPFQGTILLGHLHWDHTHGLPFFRAGDRPDGRVRVLLPDHGEDASSLMARVMSPPHFPVQLEQLRGDWTVESIEEGIHKLEGFQVEAIEIPHKQARTFGFRVSDGRSTIAYVSDHWPAAHEPGPDGLGVLHEAAMRLADGVDLLIHDAQYTAEEYPVRGSFGHAAVEYAVALAEKAGARELALFHHDPDRTDDEVDALVASCAGSSVRVRGAAEGDVIDT